MKTNLKIVHQPGETNCAWHVKDQALGKVYRNDGIFPSGVCPIMFHTLYPYFLGALFGAKYAYNEQGDCQVCCPAAKSVDVLVRVRPNDGKFESGVPADWREVIHAEVVKVNGHCDYDHQVGDRFVFPMMMRDQFACPAGIYNMYPFLDIETPGCIDKSRMRCPDWEENVFYSIEKADES